MLSLLRTVPSFGSTENILLMPSGEEAPPSQTKRAVAFPLFVSVIVSLVSMRSLSSGKVNLRLCLSTSSTTYYILARTSNSNSWRELMRYFIVDLKLSSRPCAQRTTLNFAVSDDGII